MDYRTLIPGKDRDLKLWAMGESWQSLTELIEGLSGKEIKTQYELHILEYAQEEIKNREKFMNEEEETLTIDKDLFESIENILWSMLVTLEGSASNNINKKQVEAGYRVWNRMHPDKNIKKPRWMKDLQT